MSENTEDLCEKLQKINVKKYRRFMSETPEDLCQKQKIYVRNYKRFMLEDPKIYVRRYKRFMSVGRVKQVSGKWDKLTCTPCRNSTIF